MNVVTISSTLDIPLLSLIWSKAYSIIVAFFTYWSTTLFFSLLIAMILFTLNFKMTIGFAKTSVFAPGVPLVSFD
jgi:hypothetical protein